MKSLLAKAIFMRPIIFIIGGLLGFGAGYFLQTDLLQEKERQIQELAKFNKDEQARLAAARDISESQLIKWVAMVDKTNQEYIDLSNRVAEIKLSYAQHGDYIVILFMVIASITAIVVTLVWLFQDKKDADNFNNLFPYIYSYLGELESKEQKLDKLQDGTQQQSSLGDK